MHRHSYIISFWIEPRATPPIWRGVIESARGERFYFASLEELNDLLKRLTQLNTSSQEPTNQAGGLTPDE